MALPVIRNILCKESDIMKKSWIAIVLTLCLLLSGCDSLLDGEYVYTQPHENINSSSNTATVHARSYRQLYSALEDMINDGVALGVIFVPDYDQIKVEADVKRAAEALIKEHPIAAYAVSNVITELGTSGGEPALAVEIVYVHDRAEIHKIKEVNGVEEASEKIRAAVGAFDVSIVMKVKNYEPVDFVQIVEDYAVTYPEFVIEQPAVTVNIYPDSGAERVVEVKFSYRTSREMLKEMQTRVRTMFTSASLYVSADRQDYDKLFHLYSFMMERFEYVIETSITPAYSLLLHGVGDQRSFAMVYGAMCARENIECHMVTGTRNGEPHYWNIVCSNGYYYHVDLLLCSENGEFILQTDDEMAGYVWDYDAYPACIAPEIPETEPAEK